jgi:adenylate cyclase
MFGRVPRIRELLTLVLAAMLATASALYWPSGRSGILAPLAHLEELGYDALFAIRGPEDKDIDPRIAVVTFDRNSEEDLKVQWPVPRRYDAQVIRNLVNDGAKVIAYDVLFSGATNKADDSALDKALKEAGNVVLTCRFERDTYHRLVKMEAPYYNDDLGIDFEAKSKIGFAEVPGDEATKVVRAMTPTLNFQDEWVPSFAVETYLRMIGQPDAKISISKSSVRLPGAVIPRTGQTEFDEVRHHEIPVTLIDFPAGLAFDHKYSFQQVYRSWFPKGYFKDKVVFVGLSGSELAKEISDQWATPYTDVFPELSGGSYWTEIPGVFIQAHALNAILKQAYVYELSPAWTWALVFAFSFIGLTGVRRYTNWRAWALALGSMATYQAIAIYLFIAHRVHAPYVLPLLAMTLTTGVVAWFERGSIMRTWASYVSPKVLDHILRGEGEGAAHRTNASVLFTDLRGFTSFSEGQRPERIFAILNEHFETVTKFVHDEEGTLDKFMGDGLLAVFGAPIEMPNREWHAVRAAWHMWRASLEPIYHEGQRFDFMMSVGISTGPIVSGQVGSRRRHDFTVIGDAVNTASRLQALGRQGGVQIDRATYDQVEPYVAVESLGNVEIRGKAVPMECFRVIAWSDTPMPKGVDQPVQPMGPSAGPRP